jgi:hypothetical protein
MFKIATISVLKNILDSQLVEYTAAKPVDMES